MESKLHLLAKTEAFERIPETCPVVHTEAIKHITGLNLWFQGRPWYAALSEKEKTRIELKVGDFGADLLEVAKEHGTRPLRAALVSSIQEHLEIALSPAQRAAVERGEDPWVLLSQCMTAQDAA